MALEDADLYLVNRAGTDYCVTYGVLKADIAGSIDLDGTVDLSAYALKTELPTDNAQLANGAGYITAADVPEAPEVPSLDGYAKTEDIPTDNKDLANGAGYITAADVPDAPEVPSLDGYATETWVGEQGYLTEVPEDSRLPYRLGTDKAARAGEAAIELVDAEDNFSNVKFHGAGGITCESTIDGIKIDGSGIDLSESYLAKDISNLPALPTL